jgi:transposase
VPTSGAAPASRFEVTPCNQPIGAGSVVLSSRTPDQRQISACDLGRCTTARLRECWVTERLPEVQAVRSVAWRGLRRVGTPGRGHPRQDRVFVDNMNTGGDDARRDYPCALTDAMWQVVSAHLPVRDPRKGGRPLKYSHRLIIDTILYVLVSGCAWRLVPHDLAPWDAAYRWFRHWSAQGVWDDIHDALREQVRRAEGRDPAPSAGVLDAQSAQSGCGGEAIGYDAGKKVRGRKRHLLVPFYQRVGFWHGQHWLRWRPE